MSQNTTNSVNVLLQREAFGTSHLFFVGTFGHDLALADFDQDGLLDIATTGSNGLGILLNRSTR